MADRQSRSKWTVSRVLSRAAVAAGPVKIIPLGAALPRRSSTLTRALRPLRRASDWTGRPRQCPYSSLLREGLASPPVTRLSRVGSYPTISTLPGGRQAPATPPRPLRGRAALFGGVISVALSLGSPRVGVTDFPAPWSPDFPPADGNCPPAIFRPPPTGADETSGSAPSDPKNPAPEGICPSLPSERRSTVEVESTLLTL